MRLGYQNHIHNNNSENRNDSRENDSISEEYSSHQDLDIKKNSKLNKSFTEEDSSSKPKRNSNQIKEKTFFQFMTAILNNDKKQVEKMYTSSSNPGIVDHIFLEGMTPIQYAALYGSIDCFKFLLDKKVDTDKKVEGLNLIHLSLSRAIFKNDKDICVKMFQYIYDKLPKQREYKDRLGRTYLHIIFEYDFTYALNNIEINLDDLFIKDNNDDFVINYVYIYNANQCFFKVAKDSEFLSKLYKHIRTHYEKNNKPKENFLENLFIHQNFYTIAFILINCRLFIDELIEDLINLKNFYSEENFLSNQNHENNNISEKNVYKINDNINYALDIANNLKNGIEFRGKFNFPQKIKFFTGIIYNLSCVQHIKLPEEPLKHIMTRISLFENSDRLSMLIDNENGVVLNEQVLHYIEGISYEDKINKTADNSACENVIFYESQRKSCLNDILKCHDINYIQKLKEICHTKSNNSSQKKQENHQNQPHEKGINVPKILNNLESTNPIYKNISSINYQSHFRKLDIDTYVNEYSFENIFNTSGCVLDAIDYIFNDKIKNALVLIRPPGHNAGYFGPVENGNIISTGFCLVNNIAIGAAYAKYKYRNEINKIAIFDFDLHHGNGTEEIVQMLNSKIFEKKFCYDKLCELKTRNFKQINWVDFDDAKNVLYISTHIYEKENEKENNFYPFSGGVESNTDKKSPIYPGGIYNIPLIITKDKKNFTREEYRNIIKTKVIPRLYEFKPDLIFLSAGFDCHENEIINQNYINLNEFDFSFITQQMQFVANKFCKGRLISILEGGYNNNAGVISPFIQSVFTHARFLNLSLNMFQISDIKLTGIKRQPQNIEDDNNKPEKNDNEINNEIHINNNEKKEIEENKIEKENCINMELEEKKDNINEEKEIENKNNNNI